MEQGLISEVLLPAALFIIMLGMGLSLTIADFSRVLQFPKPVVVGLISQLILLPLCGFIIASTFHLSPEFSIGIMALAACPGGVTSNLISHLSKGNLALSVTLTAITSVLAIFTIPFILNFSIAHFLTEGNAIALPVWNTIKSVIIITLIPISIGMLIRAKALNFAKKMEKPVKIASSVILMVIIAGAILKNKTVFLRDDIMSIIGSSFVLNIASMLIGFLFAALFALKLKEKITISIETGVQNATLAIFVAVSLLQNSIISIPPAIYGLVMLLNGFLMTLYFGRKKNV